jgi:ethylmalonyl-CoA mutase
MSKTSKPTDGGKTKPGAAAGKPAARPRDPVWLIRTYSGHSSAKASNELYRTNLARGQTGLSVAFDLPTQTGYDSDHAEARGEVGKVGVPICHLGDMAALFDGIPLGRMNTSMTINATAPWLLALYIAAAEKQGVARRDLAGTVQNDIIKEYLSRGTYIFPPKASLKLSADVIAFAYRDVPKWNPINICSYHLQEAGATPVQELAYTLATSIAVMDAVKASGQVPVEDLPQVIGRLSFFVNAGLRFITEMCKMRAFGELWDDLCRERWKVQDEKLRRFRYGVQVNSLGLTEQQPENNVYRVLLEMLAVTMSRDARARAVQLPAWNEALGLPRPWDQQWSIRLQQIVAEETDLLEYDDIFAGSPVIAAKVAELVGQAKEELAKIESLGGAVPAVESGYMKERLVESNAHRIAAIEAGDQTVVGVNKYTESAPSPLTSGSEAGFLAVDPQAEADQVARLKAWREQRDGAKVKAALAELDRAVKDGGNVMEVSIACAHAGVTTGEWAAALRRKFGDYRAPTGVSLAAAPAASNYLADVRDDVKRISARIGAPLKMLVGKPGLDGHSNGAEQVAVRARDCGFHVIYDGIRLTPAQIVEAAVKEGVHIIGLSILSGSHVVLVAEVIEKLRAAGLKDVPVVVGGIIPPEDEAELKAAGVARVYTPKDFDLTQIMRDIVGVVDRANQAAA